MPHGSEARTWSPHYGRAMEVRVLGAIELVDTGQRLEIGGQKQRTVLALLIANAGQPVSTDRLIEGAYGDDAPDGARRSVQTYVSNLRSQLGDMITSVSSGYVFQAIDTFIDAERFGELVESGRNKLAVDPAAASDELVEALALWRGHPYADVDARGEIDAEIARLAELRLVALESKVDADLAAGRDRELIAELDALTTEHPFRETLHAQHMLALYRTGRQAEALRSYGRLREQLAEELGVDPSPRIRDLEQRILEHDPELLLSPRSAVRRRAVLVIDLTVAAVDSLENPDERSRVLNELDRTIERSIANVDGALSVQQGTATYATFDQMRTALDVAEAINRAAPRANGAPVLRFGLDLGDVEEDPNGGVAGPAVIRAAGLVAAAHPGQILLSAEAQAAAALDSTGGSVLKALGEHAISRLENLETVHQLVLDGLPTEFPELLTDAEPPSLPNALAGAPGYELREEIGRGLFGTVYRAYQPSVGREVAIKVINPELANSTGFIRRFAVEAQMISRIEHPNVVPLHDFWRGPDAAMLVMRLMRGGNLAEWARRTDVDRAAGLRLIDQIGGALATAHALGIAHADVQASNVLLNESGDFFLSDFGIATDDPRLGSGRGQQDDVAAFAAMVAQVVPAVAFVEGEISLLESAGRGEFANAATWLETWRRDAGLAAESPTYTPSRNPYKGLAAFGELDAPDFHGRGAAVSDLVGAIANRRLIAVVGPSGIGKSSVVRAGLLPALRGGASPGSERWLIAECLPGAHPFERLVSSLIRVASSVPHDLEAQLRSDARGLVKAVERYLPLGTQLLLVIDQFEELFTLTHDEATRQAFLDLLTTACEDSSSPIRVVLTIRADFFDRPLLDPSFGELMSAGTVPISAPTDAELRELIAQPAVGLGVDFEPGLAERMVADLHGESGALPLVEFALTELFEQRESDQLTLRAYEAAGGVTAALGRRAEAIYAALAESDQEVARQLFMRLVTPGEDGRDTRHRIRRSELVRLAIDEEQLDGVLDGFGEHRLLTFDVDEVTRGSTVEVAHEALLREWPRLKGWIDSHREELVLRNRLAVAVADWEDSGRSNPHLLAGGRLLQHETWTAHSDLSLSIEERDLLVESRRVEDGRVASARRRRQLVMFGFAAVALIGVALAATALNASRTANQSEEQAIAAAADAGAARAEADQSAEEASASAEEAVANAALADRQRQLAEGRALVAAVPNVIAEDSQLALLLSMAAGELLGNAPAVTTALHETIAAQRTVYQTEWAGSFTRDVEIGGDLSADGKLLAVVGPTGTTVHVHDVDDGGLLWSQVFDVEQPAEHQVMARFIGNGEELLLGLSWQPEMNRALETPSSELGFHVVDSRTGEELRRHDSGPCGPVGKSATSWATIAESGVSEMVTVSISQRWFDEFGCIPACRCGSYRVPEIDVQRVDLATGESVPIVSGWSDGNLTVAMSGDGRRAALGRGWSPAGTFTVVDIETGDVVNVVANDSDFPGLALNHDGSLAESQGATAGESRLFDVVSGTLLRTDPGPISGFNWGGAWFSADGTRTLRGGHADPFVGSCCNGTLAIFDSATGALLSTFPSDGPVDLVRATPDLSRVARFGAESARTVTVSTIDSGSSVAGTPAIARFDPCGDASSERKFFLNQGLSVHEELLTVMALCETADTADTVLPIATGDEQRWSPGRSYTYSLADGELLASHPTFGQALAVADDGTAVMQVWTKTGAQSWIAGEVVVVDLSTGERLETLAGVCNLDVERYRDAEGALECDGPGLAVGGADIAISSDGNVVALASGWQPTVGRAWNRATGASADLAAPIAALGISPDGTALVVVEQFDPSLGGLGVLRLYTTDTFEIVAESGITSEQVRSGLEFSPDGKLVAAIAGEAGTAIRFHDTATLEVVKRLQEPHERGVFGAAFSANGSMLATVGGDGFARVWNVETLALVNEIEVGGLATAVTFLDNDRKLAVGTQSGGVGIYYLEVDDLLDEARQRLRRGFTATECGVYFPDGGCPTLEGMLAAE